MNTKYPLTVFKIILLGLFFYLVGSFVSASFLLNEWREGLRMTIAFFFMVASVFTVVIKDDIL